MKNTIRNFMPNTAQVEAIEKLEQAFNELKAGSQPPTALETNFSQLSFSIPAAASNRSFSHSISATLIPESAGDILFAMPHFSVFLTDPGNPALLTLFPFYDSITGLGNWGNSTYRRYEHIFDVNWWWSWGRTNNSNLVAFVHMKRDDYGGIGIVEADNNRDGATSGALAVDFYNSWRFVQPKADT